MTGGQVHGTCVAIDRTGVLILGPSGSGKSDLAIRLIDQGARLVSDDQILLDAGPTGLIARAPAAIRGRIELRGIGIVEIGTVPEAMLGIAIRLVAPEQIPRLPEPATWEFLGVRIPMLALAPFEASAAAKVRLAVQALNGE